MQFKSNKVNGFTLIELVVVIVILGIMASVAVPKFINLQSDARASVIRGLEGAVRGWTTLIYSRALIDGSEQTATGTVAVTGGTVATVYGYPAGTILGIEAAVELSSDEDIAVTHATGVSTYTYTGYTNCNVVYTQATATAAPTVVVTTTGATGGC